MTNVFVTCYIFHLIAKSAGAVEYTYCTSAKE